MHLWFSSDKSQCSQTQCGWRVWTEEWNCQSCWRWIGEGLSFAELIDLHVSLFFSMSQLVTYFPVSQQAMSAYGYEIVQTLIVDIEPDEHVKRAMNEINAGNHAVFFSLLSQRLYLMWVMSVPSFLPLVIRHRLRFHLIRHINWTFCDQWRSMEFTSMSRLSEQQMLY